MSETLRNFFGGNKPNSPVALNDGTVGVDDTTVFLHSDQLLDQLPSKIAVFRPEIPGQRLEASICPAQLEENTWVVLVTPPYRTSDLVETVQLQCQIIAGLQYLPKVYVVSASLLMSMRGMSDETNGRPQTQEEITVYKAAFSEIIAWGVRNNASDVHFNVEDKKPTSRIKFHIDGLYVEPARWEMPTPEMLKVLQVAWQDGKGGASPLFMANVEQQCRIEHVVDSTNIMGRWATLAADAGPSVTIRLLKTDEATVSTSMAELGYLPSQIEQFERAQTCEGGLLAIAGVVNSGKSTTLACAIDMIPEERKVITLEDPVEYRMRRAIQNTVSRQLDGGDDDVFTSKLMVIKRSAVNDVMFGEVRDRQGGRAIMELQGMGTKCYTTVHAQSAMHIAQRFASENIQVPLDYLASPGTLNLLVYQALLRTVCPDCGHTIDDFVSRGGADTKGIHQPPEYWKEYRGRLESLYDADTSSIRLRDSAGCASCRKEELPELNGYGKRTVVSEMIEPNTDRQVLRFIRNNDFLGFQEYLDNLHKAPITSPNMDNKSIMECAVYKMLIGLVDPRVVELRTMSFKTAELIKNQRSGKKA